MGRYRGRFAPSPTGDLHFGSLVAAVGSYLDARHHGGEWLVRIEDVDEPRTVPGASDEILRTLEAFGLRSDAPVVYQSQRKPLYEEALARLKQANAVYPCGCSRKDVGDSPSYPGTCRNGLPPGKDPRAWRMRVPDRLLHFEDRVMGARQGNPAIDGGDFILLRADGFFAYQLAVVVDDAEQGITHVVRGADLLESTCRQIALQDALGLARPAYLHLPIALSGEGEKLSKQRRARPVDRDCASFELYRVLCFLGQSPPWALQHAPVDRIREWAIANWNVSSIPRVYGAPVL